MDSKGNANVEVIASQVNTLTNQVAKLEAKLDAYASHFVTAEVYEIKHREIELKTENNARQIDDLWKALRQSNQNNLRRNWISNTLSGVVGAILTFLVLFFLTHL